MKFNPAKCSLLRITKKGRGIVLRQHTAWGGLICSKLTITHTLAWNSLPRWTGVYINNVTSKAQESLNFLQQNLYKYPEKIKQQAYTSYTSLVRQILEYSCRSTAWDPYFQKHISALKSVQRKAARFVKGNYRRTASVSQMLQELKWPSLQDRRTVAHLTMVFPKFGARSTYMKNDHHHEAWPLSSGSAQLWLCLRLYTGGLEARASM